MKIGIRIILILITFFLFNDAQAQFTLDKNGFSLKNSIIPRHKIHYGGPPRDGIPSVDIPKYLPISKTNIPEFEMVLGVLVNDVAIAFPIRILDRHEIVNTKFGKQPVVITYCPLCGSGAAFNAHISGSKKIFGVSGLLYNSDVLLYDRQTESLWSQIDQVAISGPLAGTELELLPTFHTTLKEWKKNYPDSKIMTEDTGYAFNYFNHKSYEGYAESKDLMFPVDHKNNDYHPKEWVAGIEIDGKFKVYPFTELKKSDGTLFDNFAEKKLKFVFNQELTYLKITTENDEILPYIKLYWFAWIAFHPETDIYTSNQQ